ncbi:kinase-like domain-containing protein [Trametes polyzona]|nr:kinase-like domain-containing protein [Trametes polyzona]
MPCENPTNHAESESLYEPPGWLKNHPELQRRGIQLTQLLKPGFVYCTESGQGPAVAVKILDPDTDEANIYQRLESSEPVPQSHTIPFELLHLERDIVIMPSFGGIYIQPYSKWPLSQFLGVFLQVVEGVEYLHSNNIAHLDLCPGNLLFQSPRNLAPNVRGQHGNIYIIDYGASQHFPSGPGVQPAITLPETQVEPPRDLKVFDPYSWDVYCLGQILEVMISLRYAQAPVETHPWILRRMVRWLYGNERGCTGVCRCRPTARTARKVLTVVRHAIAVVEYIGGLLPLVPPSSRVQK